MISNRAPALAAWTLAAVAPLAAFAAPRSLPPAVHVASLQEKPAAPPPATVDVKRLSDSEIEGLVGDLKDAGQRAMAVRGKVVYRSAVLTEAEARAILDAFLKKNGFEPKRVTLSPGGQKIEVDAWDAARGVGVAFLPGKPQFGGADRALEPRPMAAIEELALLRARGEARVLILDGDDYEYDPEGFQLDSIPTKKAAIQRLLATMEAFLRE